LKILKKKLVYKFSKYLSVYLSNIQLKEKTLNNFLKIKFNDATMIILKKSNKILLVREFRAGLKKISYGFPGGMIQDKESPIKTIIRETFEETSIKVDRPKLLFSFVSNGNYYCSKEYVFFSLIKKNTLKLSGELHGFEWADKKRILFLLKKNKFETPGILSAIYFILFKKII
jgi:8-oxo-dGTP pyrophosphatase MutT (NUDIX family)